MASTLVALALAVLAFVWVFYPLFGTARQIAQTRSKEDVQAALSKSVQELNTDLELHKIRQDDLEHIKAFLEEESSK